MPEFYGTIKRIRHRDITIEQVYVDKFRPLEEKMARSREWWEMYGEEYLKGKKTPPPPELPYIKKAKREIFGPKVTLACANSRLIDKAIESTGRLCRFTVKDGKIETIAIVTEEEKRKALGFMESSKK